MNITCNDLTTIQYDELNNKCACHRGYYGPECNEKYEWFGPILLTFNIIESFWFMFCFIWLFMRIIYMYRINKKGNLVSFLLYSTIVAIIIRMIYNWSPSVTMLEQKQTYTISLIKVILSFLSISLMLALSTVIAGFWNDILNMKRKISSKNKIIVILSALSEFVIPLIGSILILYEIESIGIVLTLIPYIINIGILIYYMIKINSTDKTDYASNINKIKWMFKYLSILLISWIVYVILFICTSIIFSTGNDKYLIITLSLYKVCNISITFSIISLIDYDFRSLKILFCSKENIETSKSSKMTTTSLNNSGDHSNNV